MSWVKRFINDEKSVGLILIICTVISLIIANSFLQHSYEHFWSFKIFGLSLEHWVNDGLMAVFFLMVGLELKTEMFIGEFSKPKNAILPMAAAIGGMLVPALFYFMINRNSELTISGIGIPMATDIAFALGILSLLGKRVPTALRVFLMALAVVDDLGAIIVIAVFYTSDFDLVNFLFALFVYLILIGLNKFKITSLTPYLIGGVIMWYFMLSSGIHATITGVLIAFVIPFNDIKEKRKPVTYLLHKIHIPVSFLILPIFALANTAIPINEGWHELLDTPLSLGIFAGLVFGKPIGITFASILVVYTKLAVLPQNVKWKNIIGVSCLGGIGFTMSIFIALLAFDNLIFVNEAKIMILLSSLCAGIVGYLYLFFTLKPTSEVNKTKL